MRIAGYNPPHTMTTGTRKLSAAIAFLLLLGSMLHASEWDVPASTLAREIAGISGPGTISLQVRNSSSLPTEAISAIRRRVEEQLRSTGVRVVDQVTAASDVTLTLSENVHGYLLVAEVKQGTDVRVVMQSFPRTQTASTATASNKTVTLRTTLLLSQSQKILDATQLSGLSPYLAVLEPEQVIIYRMSAGSWAPEQSFPITHSRVWPRDLRGRLVPATDHLFDVYLPGTACAASATAPLQMECRDSDDPWPLGEQRAFFGASRNFFNGVLTPGIGKETRVEPFYSAAPLKREKYTLWTMAGVDGRVRQYDGFNVRTVTAARNWGSDIASINADCSTFLLATENGDRTGADALRVYEVADREPTEASQPAEFPGPITVLWKSDSQSATAVVHNLKTGKYEAYNVTLACNR